MATRAPIRHPPGLTTEQAAARLAQDGPNTLPAQRTTQAGVLLLRQFTHVFALMLWVASVLALVAGMPALGVAIVVVIVLNGLFAFAQEWRADRSTQRLRALLPTRVVVRRDGRRVTVDAADLVVGDLVVLHPGDRVCADAVLSAVASLAVDESMLTGESVPARPQVGDRCYAGTFVVDGEGEGEVVATAGRTRLAEIAAMTTASPRPPTPLARRLQQVVRVISLVAVSLGVVFFLLSLALGAPPQSGFLLAIGVTVALVPEGLLAEAVVEMAAFLTVLLVGGWVWATQPEPALLAVASGAAFAAVVLGQLGNAFACRSEHRPVWRIPPTTNRLLLVAVAVEAALLLVVLSVPLLTSLLGGSWPSALGWAIAFVSPVAVVLVDAVDKAARVRRERTVRAGVVPVVRPITRETGTTGG